VRKTLAVLLQTTQRCLPQMLWHLAWLSPQSSTRARRNKRRKRAHGSGEPTSGESDVDEAPQEHELHSVTVNPHP